MQERDIAFFQPLWRRVAVTAFCVIWSIFEWLTGAPFWGIIAGGLAFYCYWKFFHTFEEIQSDKSDEKPKE